MDNNQEAASQPAEETAPAESAPVEEKTDDSLPQKEAEVESSQPEKKVSESVPYDRFSEVNSEKKRLAEENAWLRSQVAPAQTASAPEIPSLDPESDVAVRAAARDEFSRQWEARKEQEFVSRHPELNEDKVLAGTTSTLIREANRQGRHLDQEVALTQAKKLLEEKIKPVQKEANQEGFKEGQDVARKKEQLGEVGSSNYREPEVDDNDLSAAEFRKKHNIPII